MLAYVGTKDGNFTDGYGYTVPAWAGYGNTFIPMGITHTLPIMSWVGHGYSPLAVGILIPYPFILICGSIVVQ
jgi:hypothetical protein